LDVDSYYQNQGGFLYTGARDAAIHQWSLSLDLVQPKSIEKEVMLSSSLPSVRQAAVDASRMQRVSFDSPHDSQQFRMKQSQGSLLGYDKILEHNTRLCVEFIDVAQNATHHSCSVF
jgi:hypothetical protein